MKHWKYHLIQSVAENGEPILAEHLIEQNEANEEIAKREAYKGIYEPFDDGQPEIEQPMTDAERIAQLEEALEMLLSGVTE